MCLCNRVFGHFVSLGQLIFSCFFFALCIHLYIPFCRSSVIGGNVTKKRNILLRVQTEMGTKTMQFDEVSSLSLPTSESPFLTSCLFSE